MGFKFWAQEKVAPPTNGEWYLGGDYQQYLTSDRPGNFVAFDVVRRLRFSAATALAYMSTSSRSPPDLRRHPAANPP